MKKLLLSFLLAFLAGFAAQASAATTGSLIKGQSFNSVYYYSDDGKRYVFPNDKTFLSWYDNFDSVVTVSDADLASITIGGNVTYRPGKKLVKVETDPKVYAVDKNGTLRWVETEALATELYGAEWAKNVDDVPDIFFTNYKIGPGISSAADFNADTLLGTIASIADDKTVTGGAISVVPTQPVIPTQPVVTPPTDTTEPIDTPTVPPAEPSEPIVTQPTTIVKKISYPLCSNVNVSNFVGFAYEKRNQTDAFGLMDSVMFFSPKLENIGSTENLDVEKVEIEISKTGFNFGPSAILGFGFSTSADWSQRFSHSIVINNVDTQLITIYPPTPDFNFQLMNLTNGTIPAGSQILIHIKSIQLKNHNIIVVPPTDIVLKQL